MPIVNIPGVGDIVLVDRDQLRVRSNSRRLSIPHGMMGLMETIPAPPPTFTVSKGNTIKYPILGNNRYGNCFYCYAAHQAQTWTGNSGTEFQFDVNQLTARYLVIAGGDNGLDDGTIMPEFKSGIVGPNGPRKILDWATINPSDMASVALGMWGFCGLGWTASLPSGWANNAKPGTVWGTRAGRSVGGHAMHLTGINAKGLEVRTWGIDDPEPIYVTHDGMMENDPELIVAFSLDMFDANGIAKHINANYDQLSGLWTQLTGKTLPPLATPFPPSKPLDWFA